MVAESGELTRVESPRELMKCLGLMPSEDTSAERRRHGSLTTAGNPHARRALVEGAWAYRDPAKGNRHLQRRLEKHPKSIQDISGKAQGRRCQRDRQLIARGTQATGVTVAMAREVGGFLWAIAKQGPVPLSGQDSARHSDARRRSANAPRKRRRPGVVSPAAA
jgi:transposase